MNEVKLKWIALADPRLDVPGVNRLLWPLLLQSS